MVLIFFFWLQELNGQAEYLCSIYYLTAGQDSIGRERVFFSVSALDLGTGRNAMQRGHSQRQGQSQRRRGGLVDNMML